MSSDVIYQRGADTAWRTIVGETIVVHLGAKEFFGLNESGAQVWLALDGTADPGVLSARFGIAREDVESFCSELLTVGLVEVVNEARAPMEVSPASDKSNPRDSRGEDADPPCIVWREEIQHVAQTCAFLPAQNPLCNQVPTS